MNKYFIIFTTALLLAASCSWWQWLVADVGYLGIVYVMFSGARRLELCQNLVYGSDLVYQA